MEDAAARVVEGYPVRGQVQVGLSEQTLTRKFRQSQRRAVKLLYSPQNPASVRAATVGETASTFVGIGVARHKFDVFVRPTDERWAVTYDEEAPPGLIQHLLDLHPTLVVLDGTGSLQPRVAAEFAISGLPVVVVNSRQVCDFAHATGRLAKADHINAEVIACFAEAVQPAIRLSEDAAIMALKAMVARRRELVAMRGAEQNRLGATNIERVRQSISAVIDSLNRQIAAFDQDIDWQVRASPVWQCPAYKRGAMENVAALPIIGNLLDTIWTYLSHAALMICHPIRFSRTVVNNFRNEFKQASKFFIAGIFLSYLVNIPWFIKYQFPVPQALYIIGKSLILIFTIPIVHFSLRILRSRQPLLSTTVVYFYAMGFFMPFIYFALLPVIMTVDPRSYFSDLRGLDSFPDFKADDVPIHNLSAAAGLLIAIIADVYIIISLRMVHRVSLWKVVLAWYISILLYKPVFKYIYAPTWYWLQENLQSVVGFL